MKSKRSSFLDVFLNHPVISRIRRNHGLEHATMHVLSESFPALKLAGKSDMTGFWIVGDVSAEALERAVQKAIERLQAGEKDLAVHPNCGTNLMTAAVVAGIAAFLAMFGSGRRFRDKIERLPLVIILTALAMILAKPLGMILQERFTVASDVGPTGIVDVVPAWFGWFKAHKVVTRDL